MSTNPFEDPDATYRLLLNDDGHYSLWPSLIAIPAGWRVAYEGSRDACLKQAADQWRDMRPNAVRLS